MFKTSLEKVKFYLNQYKDISPQELYTKCIEEKLDVSLESYLNELDQGWLLLYQDSDEGLLELLPSEKEKNAAFASIKKSKRYNLTDILYQKVKLENAKQTVKEYNAKKKKVHKDE